MKRESITALRWYFLNCSVTQFYGVQVFSSPKYIHVSEESSTNLLLINKLLLTKDEGPNSYKQYLRGCRMILSQIFSLFPSPPPPVSPLPPPLPQHPVAGIQNRGVPAPLGTNTQSGGEDTSHVPALPNSDKVSPGPPSSGVHAYPHGEGPCHMFTSKSS